MNLIWAILSTRLGRDFWKRMIERRRFAKEGAGE